ncbi:hypothetical protein Bcep1808_7364 (plasmid) [Burkholderia vietnamiensis G4]|uniref:Uncharacterized protein n=1 Tax=Burkholderia vietnamiensis (strain G4 / LMG 22486) TaxID=269482 RepID=A4JVD8_BURVG|nr:hypothetical protein Bcep1808_7364 [Burkholderia vietnamiensis G4]
MCSICFCFKCYHSLRRTKLKNPLDLQYKVAAALTVAMLSTVARADQQFDLNNISGTSGAGSADFTAWANKIKGYLQSGVNLVLLFFAAAGIVLCGTSIKKVYDANKDNREPPKVAIIGIIVGAALTIVTVIIGIIRNSATPG